MVTECKVAVVTGAGQGVGKGIARALLEDGMTVVIADIDEAAGAEAAGELAGFGAVTAMPADVSQEASVIRLMSESVSRFGRLDVLINNAGIFHPGGDPVERLALEDWNRVIATNLTGSFLCTKHAAPALRRDGGAIVNIASTRALQSEPNTEAYTASKGGIVALTHALAISLGPEIRVNCVSPGWIAVDDWKKAGRRHEPELTSLDHAQHPAGRVGRPLDIAAMVSFLVSNRAGFITGQNFVVDGGMTRRMIYAES